MELIATKGAANATSYVTPDEADDYLEFTHGADEWTERTDKRKEALLVTATRAIDRYHVVFAKLDETQALKFPVNTYNRTDREGNNLGDGFDKAKEATILHSYFLFLHGGVLEEAQGQRIEVVKSYKMGPTSAKFCGFNPLATLASEALSILSPYLFLQVRATR